MQLASKPSGCAEGPQSCNPGAFRCSWKRRSAGADAFFFSGLPLQEQAKAYDALKKPLMMGATPTLTGAEAKANKVSLLFCHVENVGIGAIHQALKELKSTGKYETAAKMMLSAEVNQKLVAQSDWTARARKYNIIKT